MSKLLDKNSINLIALNLQKPTAINLAVYGNFSQAKAHEFVVAKGNVVELFRPDETGKMISICSSSVFAVVRSLIPFRLAGGTKDYLLIGSDSGKISISEYDSDLNDWKIVHCEVFGKTGCRRIVPGQFLAADPKGRSIMIGALEKQKFVYVMNRDNANRLTVSSPQEAHKADTFVLALCGVDVGFENPCFATIEIEHNEIDINPDADVNDDVEKKLTYYELDLGLNHVVRKWSEPISRTAFMLFAIPGGDDGPSGMLITGENWVSFKHQGHDEIRTALPRRKDLPVERGVLITAGAIHKRKDSFFYLLQSEYGDLYKCTLVLDPNNNKIVQNLIVTVFDTIQPCNSLCIARSGLLFGASEFGNHVLYQFVGIGDDSTAVKSERVSDELNETLGDDAASAATVAPVFTPSKTMTNLQFADEMPSLAPITDMLIENLSNNSEDLTPQIHCLCGRGNRSSLRILRHGIAVTEMAVSELPGVPNAVWTVRASYSSPFDKYIIVSFIDATLVLSVGETVQEVTDSGFLTTTRTMQVSVMADDALVQVHKHGIRHIRTGNRISEWKTTKPIEHAATNARQVIVALAGGQLIYFELDSAGQLMEVGSSHDIRKDVSSLDLGEIPEGRIKSPFVAVGCCDDTVQVLSLDSSDLLSQRSSKSLPARPDSVCLVQMIREIDTGSGSSAGSSSKTVAAAKGSSNLYLNIGLSNGILVRVVVDPVTGSMSDAREKFLGGNKSVKLFRVGPRDNRSVLALCTRSWLLYNHQGRYHQTPLSYDSLAYASDFSSELCPDGVVAIAGDTLRIVVLNELGTLFNQTAHPLRYTPRKMCIVTGSSGVISGHASTGNSQRYLGIIETDHNEYNQQEKEQLASQSNVSDETGPTPMSTNGAEEAPEEEEFEIPLRGPVPSHQGKWASCVRIFEASSGETKDLVELAQNEAAFSICSCKFLEHSNETFVIVGTARDVTLHPMKCSAAFINVYQLIDSHLKLLHQTPVEEIPFALCEFNGRLLVGVGKCLRLYELGKRKLLRKCENKTFPTNIVKILTKGERIFVGDMAESMHFVKFKKQESSLVIFADDSQPKYVSSACVIDYSTIGAVDKFGNVSVLRLPANVNDDNYENPSGARVLWDQSVLNGAPNKLETLATYHLGETCTAISMCSLVQGGREAMIVSTVMGGIYAFMPFISREDTDFFTHLEMFMRQEKVTLCQRDHLSYRSYYQPVKHVIDGDLCELFALMPAKKQQEMAADVGRTTSEVNKKLEDIRNFLM